MSWLKSRFSLSYTGGSGGGTSKTFENVVFKSPPHTGVETLTATWATTTAWDISTHISNASIPSSAKKILLSFWPTELADVSTFIFRDSADVDLYSIDFGGDLMDYQWSNSGVLYGSMVAVPANTKKIYYSSRGGHYHVGTNNFKRVITIFGYTEDVTT